VREVFTLLFFRVLEPEMFLLRFSGFCALTPCIIDEKKLETKNLISRLQVAVLRLCLCSHSVSALALSLLRLCLCSGSHSGSLVSTHRMGTQKHFVNYKELVAQSVLAPKHREVEASQQTAPTFRSADDILNSENLKDTPDKLVDKLPKGKWMCFH
jgi:hypothetical protein